MYSKTYASSIVMVIVGVGAILGIDMDEGSITEVVMAALTIVSFGVSLYERYKKGGINFFGLKK